jgi:hypothetical protein
MKQLGKDLAVFLQPGCLVAIAALVVPYAIGVFFLVRTCNCL